MLGNEGGDGVEGRGKKGSDKDPHSGGETEVWSMNAKMLKPKPGVHLLPKRGKWTKRPRASTSVEGKRARLHGRGDVSRKKTIKPCPINI